MEVAQHDFYSSWEWSALLELVDFIPLPEEGVAVAEKLRISHQRLEEGLQILEGLGFIKKVGASFRKVHAMVSTSPETHSMNVRRYHHVMVTRALEGIDRLSPRERDFQSLTLALQEKEFQELRSMIFRFIEQANEKYSSTSAPDKIYQLKVQLFPLANLR
jgi:uncharacterized protein (TIGR02147 family)